MSPIRVPIDSKFRHDPHFLVHAMPRAVVNAIITTMALSEEEEKDKAQRACKVRISTLLCALAALALCLYFFLRPDESHVVLSHVASSVKSVVAGSIATSSSHNRAHAALGVATSRIIRT